MQNQGTIKTVLVKRIVLSLVWSDFRIHVREWQIMTLKREAKHIFRASRKSFTVLSREVTQSDLLLERCFWYGAWIEGNEEGKKGLLS